MSGSDKYMIQLGHISVAFSTFDYLINEINCTLINYDNHKIGNLISSNAMTDGRLKLYRGLLKTIEFPESTLSLANDILTSFEEIKSKRNHLIHCLWHTKSESEFEKINYYDFHLAKIGSDLNSAQRIDFGELASIKDTMIALIDRQVDLNAKLASVYREILNKEMEKRNLLLKSLNNVIPPFE